MASLGIPDADTKLESSGWRVRLLVITSQRLVVGCIREALGATNEFEIVAVIESGPQAVSEARRLHADIGLLDIYLADSNGLEIAPALVQVAPATKLILIIPSPEFRRISLERGAVETIFKDRLAEGLVTVLRAVTDTVRHSGSHHA